ncbi:MAG: alanine racemase [bacterium]
MVEGNFRIVKPTLVLDEPRARRNLQRMASKAAAAGVHFRPHFKTFQAAVIGEWFRDGGISACTVSSLDMAEYFADHGWTDITVAFPVNLRELDLVNELAGRIELGLLVDTPAVLDVLENRLNHEVRVWVKIDAGYGRVGVWWEDHDSCRKIVAGIVGSRRLQFAGLLTHSGHSYHATDIAAIQEIHVETTARLQGVRQDLAAAGFPDCLVSIGDTPTCSVVDDFSGSDEIRPGNFIFNDLMMESLGVCRDVDIAVAVACPVVGLYPRRKQLVVHGGAVHFGKEFLPGSDGAPVYGYLTTASPDSLGRLDRQAVLVSLSQEHGVIQVPASYLDQVAVGDLVHVLPIHSCLTANLYDSYLTLDGVRIPRR